MQIPDPSCVTEALRRAQWLLAMNIIQQGEMEEKMNKKVSNAAALGGLAFLLGGVAAAGRLLVGVGKTRARDLNDPGDLPCCPQEIP